MPQLSFRPNRAYPSIPTISGDVQSHTNALYAIREAIDIHERRTKNYLDSFVRVQELVDLGLITLDGNIVVDPNDDADGSDTHHHDSLYIRLDGTSPATTGQVEFGAGIDVVGNITATSYDGILAANLLDKTASEIITAPWEFHDTVQIRTGFSLTLWDPADTGAMAMFHSGAAAVFAFGGADYVDIGTQIFGAPALGFRFGTGLFLEEQAAATTDVAAFGQIWVKDDVPNTLWFTNDAGTDIQLGVSGGGDETLLWFGL